MALISSAFLAFANGANDNFKGVSTIYGSNLASFRMSLVWATITTFAGSALAFLLAGDLITSFTGKGLVPDDIFSDKAFPLSVALATAATVLLASRFGLPVSTTHALTAALIGASILGATGVNSSRLGALFLFPLLLSPVVAFSLTASALAIVRATKGNSPSNAACLCVSAGVKTDAIPASVLQVQTAIITPPQLFAGNITDLACVQSQVQVTTRSIPQVLHFLSAGLVSFARGLNDTPKIAAILIASGGVTQHHALIGVGIFIAIGGWLYSRRVAETMAHKITPMSETGGLTANIITAALVIGASRLGIPVSTTHVSTGAIFGIGAMSGKLQWKTLRSIALAWLTTLPIAALLSAITFTILRKIIA